MVWNSTVESPSMPAAAGAASTRTLLIHCLGRSALRSPRTTDGRLSGLGTRGGAGAVRELMVATVGHKIPGDAAADSLRVCARRVRDAVVTGGRRSAGSAPTDPAGRLEQQRPHQQDDGRAESQAGGD